MSINYQQITIANISIVVVKKDIRNLHLSVLPPSGDVRITAPLTTSDDAIRLFAISKIAWVKKRRKSFAVQPRESPRDYVTGESHYFRGKRYLLNVLPGTNSLKVQVKHRHIELYTNQYNSRQHKEAVIQKFYRNWLKETVPSMITKWEAIMGVEVKDYRIRRMKTKWGSCSIQNQRLWLNLELAKKPMQCLEYVIVHEMVHLLERRHNERFISYLNKFMPQWRMYKEELNSLPL